MGPATAIKTCFRKYATFSGRASRPEYWWFAAFIAVFAFCYGFLIEEFAYNLDYGDGSFADPFLYIELAVFILLILPNISVTVRRLHDIGLSGWFFLAFLITSGVAGYVTTMESLIVLQVEDTEQNPLVTPLDIKPAINFSALASPNYLIMAVGIIVMALPSQHKTNKYGPNPNEVPS